jgi:hypothetical protein
MTGAMSAPAHVGDSARSRIGSSILLVAAGLMTLNDVVLLLALDEPVLFLGFAAFNLHAVVIIAIPFRRRERWAWYATWMLPIGLAAPASPPPTSPLSTMSSSPYGSCGWDWAERQHGRRIPLVEVSP